MGRYLWRRLLISIPVLFGITLGTYLMASLAPGDPVTIMINPETAASLGPDWVATQRAQLGLNKPLPVRYVLWLGQVIRGNLGYSTQDRQPVAPKIRERFGPTLRLMGTALLLSLIIAVPIGVLSALKQYSILDYVVTVAGFSAIAVPSFFLALAGIFVFSVKLGWLPAANMNTVGRSATFVDALHHLILPAAVLGLAEAASLIRYIRSSMLEVIHQEYVTVARAKGLRERVVIFRHAMRNALIPVVTVVALRLPVLIGGAVIIETIFAWPGMGQLAIRAVKARDYPVIMAVNLITAVTILASNLLADVIYVVIDPRIKYT
jgi:peptide/nickel transport system permease protein